MIEIAEDLFFQLLTIIFGLTATWVLSIVFIFYIAGRDVINSFKLFFYNKFRGGGYGLVRIMGQDLRERTAVRKINGLYSVDKGTYGGTPDVTFNTAGYPLRQHVRGFLNAVDLLQKETRKVTFKVDKTPCKNCGQDVELAEAEIKDLAVPIPGPSDASGLVEHAIVMAQTTHPDPGLNPKTVMWLAILGVGCLLCVALITLFSNPQFPEFLGALSQMR